MGNIPESKDTDHDDVQLALDVAKSRLANGDHDEAIKWLRKAADTAFDVGDDRRGIELSKAAAELKPGGAPGPTPSTAPGPPVPGPAPAPLAPSPVGSKVSVPPSGLPKPLHRPVVPTASTMQAHPRVGRSNPPPKRSQSQAPPAARGSEPKAPPQRKAPSERPAPPPPPDASATDLRRMEGKPELPKRTTDEEDATRELLISDRLPPPTDRPPAVAAAPTGDEWPTESVSHVSEAGEFTDRMQQGELSQRPADADIVTSAPPLHSQALRVAVGRSEEGAVVLRLLDSAGLQEGEHDAMLVALTSDTDLTELFR